MQREGRPGLETSREGREERLLGDEAHGSLFLFLLLLFKIISETPPLKIKPDMETLMCGSDTRNKLQVQVHILLL